MRQEAGFSLIEICVALCLLALSLAAVNRVIDHSRSALKMLTEDPAIDVRQKPGIQPP